MCKPVPVAAVSPSDQELALGGGGPGPGDGPERPTFLLELRPERSCEDPIRSLRQALKVLLRRFGLRALSVEERQAGAEL